MENTAEKQFYESLEQKFLGSRLRALRLEKGFTLDDVCKRLAGKVKPSILGKYERGERFPKAEPLGKLAELYDVDVDYLIGLTNVRSRSVFSDRLNEITDEEKSLVSLFSQSDRKKQRLIMDVFKIYGEQEND